MTSKQSDDHMSTSRQRVARNGVRHQASTPDSGKDSTWRRWTNLAGIGGGRDQIGGTRFSLGQMLGKIGRAYSNEARQEAARQIAVLQAYW